MKSPRENQDSGVVYGNTYLKVIRLPSFILLLLEGCGRELSKLVGTVEEVDDVGRADSRDVFMDLRKESAQVEDVTLEFGEVLDAAREDVHSLFLYPGLHISIHFLHIHEREGKRGKRKERRERREGGGREGMRTIETSSRHKRCN